MRCDQRLGGARPQRPGDAPQHEPRREGPELRRRRPQYEADGLQRSDVGLEVLRTVGVDLGIRSLAVLSSGLYLLFRRLDWL